MTLLSHLDSFLRHHWRHGRLGDDALTPLDLPDHTHADSTQGGALPAGSITAHASRHASDAADELAILAEQAANVVLAGPTTGAAADPAFRALVAADAPVHDHTAAGQGGDYAWADITGFGIEPGAVSSADGTLSEVAFTANVEPAAVTLTYPGTWQAGDVYVAEACCDGLTPISTPAGWTLVGGEAYLNCWRGMWVYVPVSAPSGTTVWWNGVDATMAYIISIRGANPTTPLSGYVQAHDNPATSLALASVTVPAGGWLLGSAFTRVAGGSGITQPTSWTNRQALAATNFNGMFADYRAAPTGASGTITWSCASAATIVACAVAIVPAVGSGQVGTATTVSRGDHNHDLGTHAHSNDLSGGALTAAVLPSHAHTSAATGGDFPWGDITGFGIEPGAVSSSTSGQEGASLTVSRGDHNHDLGQHAHAAAASGGQVAYSAITGTPTLDSGTYTPTLTAVANVDGSTAYVCQYLRVGNVVTVSGELDVDPTTVSTITRLGISLPVASNFAASSECGGTAIATALGTENAIIYADVTNNRAEMYWTTTRTTNTSFRFTFTYLVV